MGKTRNKGKGVKRVAGVFFYDPFARKLKQISKAAKWQQSEPIQQSQEAQNSETADDSHLIAFGSLSTPLEENK